MTSILKVNQIQNTAGGAPTAADLGLNVAGSVLQVVQSVLSTQTTIQTTSLLDTGMTATITPTSSSSKILVLCSIQSTIQGANGSWAGWYELLRGSTSIAGTARQWTQDNNTSGNQADGTTMKIDFLDSPSTTSATTYKVQGYVGNASYPMQVNNGNIGESTITLMEIAG